MYFLLITALTVSIDSFICGFSFALKSTKKSFIVLLITLTVFAMCIITNYLATVLYCYLTEKTASLSGIILIGIGIYNLLKKEDDNENPCCSIKQILVAGFAVGIDGALANLSLSIMGYSAFYVPVIIAVMHGIMISIGILLSQTKISKKLAKIKFVAPLILIGLGIYKLIGFFI